MSNYKQQLEVGKIIGGAIAAILTLPQKKDETATEPTSTKTLVNSPVVKSSHMSAPGYPERHISKGWNESERDYSHYPKPFHPRQGKAPRSDNRFRYRIPVLTVA